MPGTDALSLVFSALADPTRRAILVRLSEGEATVNELAEPFDISLPAISRHLKVLAEAGLIERSKQAQWRTNTLNADGLTGATGFIEELTRVWGERFDRLDSHLACLKTQLGASSSITPPGDDRQPSITRSDDAHEPSSSPSGDGPVPPPSHHTAVPSGNDGSTNTPGATTPPQDGDAPSGEESV